MGEFQVTADGETLPLPKPFMVIATQNMLESHGVFPLPDSQTPS
jgi:MoxR-like ATPase